MTYRLFVIATLAVTLIGSHAEAQLSGGLPSELVLNRQGLTMDWWGQAVLDPSRDTVRYLTADEQNVYVQSTSGIITAFSAESGRTLWSNLVGTPDQTSFPAATNDELLMVAIGLNVYALDKNKGELIWNLVLPNQPSAAPEVDENQIYIGCVDGSVYSYDIRRIRELHESRMLPRWTHMARMWRFKSPKEVVSPPILAGPTVAFASQVGIVYGLSNKDKGLRFQFETDDTINTPIGRSRDKIFIATTGSRLYCINQLNGRIQWSYSSGTSVGETPMAIGNSVYVIPRREGLKALTITGGITKWEHPTVTTFLAASETKIYAKDQAGTLLILDRESGETIGQIPMRHFELVVNNDRTDRAILATSTGTVILLREVDSEYPLYHLYPERRPILPELAPEPTEQPGEAAADA